MSFYKLVQALQPGQLGLCVAQHSRALELAKLAVKGGCKFSRNRMMLTLPNGARIKFAGPALSANRINGLEIQMLEVDGQAIEFVDWDGWELAKTKIRDRP